MPGRCQRRREVEERGRRIFYIEVRLARPFSLGFAVL